MKIYFTSTMKEKKNYFGAYPHKISIFWRIKNHPPVEPWKDFCCVDLNHRNNKHYYCGKCRIK